MCTWVVGGPLCVRRPCRLDHGVESVLGVVGVLARPGEIRGQGVTGPRSTLTWEEAQWRQPGGRQEEGWPHQHRHQHEGQVLHQHLDRVPHQSQGRGTVWVAVGPGPDWGRGGAGSCSSYCEGGHGGRGPRHPSCRTGAARAGRGRAREAGAGAAARSSLRVSEMCLKLY